MFWQFYDNHVVAIQLICLSIDVILQRPKTACGLRSGRHIFGLLVPSVLAFKTRIDPFTCVIHV